MLPELKYGKRWGMDKSFYFNSKLKEFLDLTDEEPIGKINMQAMRELREAREELSLCVSKYGMLVAASIAVKDQSTLSYSLRINRSLKEQRNLAFAVEKKCKKIRLNQEWLQGIHQYVYEPIMERCARLNSQNLPELIAISKLCVYDDYLKKQGKTLNEDIQENLGFYGDSDNDEEYYNNVMKTIEKYEKTLTQDELDALLEKYNAHNEISAIRKARAEKEKAERKAQKIADFEKDAIIILQNWATDTVQREDKAPKPSTERFYKRVYEMLGDMVFEEEVETVPFKAIAVVRHNPTGRISTSAFRWLKRNDETNEWDIGGATLQNAYPFFDTYDPNTYESALAYCEKNNLIVATVDMSTNYKVVNEKDFVYDYYDRDGFIDSKRKVIYSKRTLVDMTVEERQMAVWIRFHETLMTIHCARILQKAYEKYGAKEHVLNDKTVITKLNSDFGEMLLYHADLQNLSIEKYDDTERIRSWQIRMSSLKNKSDNLIRNNIMVQWLDAMDWVKFVKGFVDINDVKDSDIKKLAMCLNLI